MGHHSISPTYEGPTSQPTEVKGNATNVLVLATTVQLQTSCVPALTDQSQVWPMTGPPWNSLVSGMLDWIGIWEFGSQVNTLDLLATFLGPFLSGYSGVAGCIGLKGGTTTIRERWCHEGEVQQRFVKRVKLPPCNKTFVVFGPLTEVFIWRIFDLFGLLNWIWSEC